MNTHEELGRLRDILREGVIQTSLGPVQLSTKERKAKERRVRRLELALLAEVLSRWDGAKDPGSKPARRSHCLSFGSAGIFTHQLGESATE